MAETKGRPVWVDLSSTDAAGSRAFYSQLFGWQVDVNPDPQYGGYARATIDGKDVAGISPSQSPGAPTAWMVYIGTPDAAGLGDAVAAAGGTVVMPAFEVGDQGHMAVFQDPTGAFISAWQPLTMGGFEATGPGTFAWAEVTARGIDRANLFYEAVFGWGTRTSDMPDGTKYFEFLEDGDSIAGGMEMPSTGRSTSRWPTWTRLTRRRWPRVPGRPWRRGTSRAVDSASLWTPRARSSGCSRLGRAHKPSRGHAARITPTRGYVRDSSVARRRPRRVTASRRRSGRMPPCERAPASRGGTSRPRA